MKRACKVFLGLVFFMGVGVGSAVAGSVPSGAVTLDATGIQKQIAGNTIAGSNWEEFYAPSGVINGRYHNHAYTARWDVDGTKMCFHYLHPTTDYCKTVAVEGTQVYFILENGELDEYSPATLKSGNPDGL